MSSSYFHSAAAAKLGEAEGSHCIRPVFLWTRRAAAGTDALAGGSLAVSTEPRNVPGV